jgi:RND family efflux transporter MFP subunit
VFRDGFVCTRTGGRSVIDKSDVGLEDTGKQRTEPPRSLTTAKQLGLLVVLLAGGVALWFSDVPAMLLGGDNADGRAARSAKGVRGPVSVMVAPVRLLGEDTVVQSPGTGIASKSVTLFPETAGRVSAILFSAGQTVKKGDPLMRLDDRAESLAVDLARVRLEEVRRNFERKKKLAPRGTVARADVELAETQLAAARITLAQREHELSERTLVAPFDGVTGIAQVDPGERVSQTTAVTTLDDRSTILVDFDVPEAHAGAVRIGAELIINAWAAGERTFRGTVKAIESRIDAATRTMRVRAAVPNDHDLLRPGMSFVVRLPLRGNPYPAVPSFAVQWDRQGAFVWRVADGRAERVGLRILKRTDTTVLADAKLAEGDLVVVEGVQQMRDGATVRIIKGAPREAEAEGRG